MQAATIHTSILKQIFEGSRWILVLFFTLCFCDLIFVTPLRSVVFIEDGHILFGVAWRGIFLMRIFIFFGLTNKICQI